MGGVLDGDGGGFADTFPKFTPKAIQHEFGGGFAPWIFGDAGNVQADPLSLLVAKNVVPALV